MGVDEQLATTGLGGVVPAAVERVMRDGLSPEDAAREIIEGGGLNPDAERVLQIAGLASLIRSVWEDLGAADGQFSKGEDHATGSTPATA